MARRGDAGRTLESVIRAPQRRRWRVFKLLGSQPKLFRDAEELQRALADRMGSYFQQRTRVKLHRQALWMHMAVEVSGAVAAEEHVYMVHPPHSCFLFVTQIRRKEVVPVFLQALGTAFDCPEVKELQLVGNDVDTLSSLALQKLSQGAFSSYRLCTEAFDGDPLESPAQASQRRQAVIDKVLAEHGAKEAQAALQGTERNRVVVKSEKRKPEYRLTARGAQDAAKFSQLCVRSEDDLSFADGSQQVPGFQCFIRLEGKDVLNGLESLYGNDLVVPGEALPTIFDASDLLERQLSSKRLKASKNRERNRVLWMKTN